MENVDVIVKTCHVEEECQTRKSSGATASRTKMHPSARYVDPTKQMKVLPLHLYAIYAFILYCGMWLSLWTWMSVAATIISSEAPLETSFDDVLVTFL
jgi:hypothetical protein